MAYYLPTVLLTLAVIILTLPTQTLTDSPDMAQCSASLLLLAPCMPFVQGGGPMPTDQCCNGLANLVRDHPSCVCPMLDSSASLPVNKSLVLQLPALCQVDVASTVNTTCPGMAVPLPPSESPHASKNTSCSCPAYGSSLFPLFSSILVPGTFCHLCEHLTKPVPIASPLIPQQKARDQLLGKNKGQKMKLKRTHALFHTLVLVLAIAI